MSDQPRFVMLFVRHSLPLLMLVLIAVVMLGANPLAGETTAPFDILVRYPGWKNTGIESPVKHHKHSDVLDYKLPSWRIAREKLRQGELPVWNPHVLGGEPLMLLITRSILTPAFAVYAAIDDEGIGLYGAALVNLLVVSVGSYLLFLGLGANRLAALLGAVAFSYCGFNLSWFLWHHVNTSIWIPWMLLFGLRIVQSGDVRQLPWFALASTLMILGGFPTVAVYGYLALLLMFLCWALFSRNGFKTVLHRGTLGAAGMVLSLMLAFLFLFCLDESLGRLDLSYRRGGSAFRSVEDLALFVLPFSDGPLTLGRTGYVGLLPLILFPPALWLTWRSRFDWRYAWGLSLVVVISPIAFAWIPMEYLRQIPLIGTSMISRLILIIALGFSLLAVLVLSAVHERFRGIAPVWSAIALILLLIVQVYDQRQVFQKLVGHVKAETIYPLTPTIDYVRNNVEPLQNVVSDRGYLFPGVLSAYGLSEWFAHGFHTREEKHLLEGVVDGPYLTATAAGFSCDQVRFDDVTSLTYLGVRYVLCSSGPKHGPGPELKEVFNSVANPGAGEALDLMGHRAIQHVVLHGQVSFDLIELPLQADEAADPPMVRLKLWKRSRVTAQSEPCTTQRDSKGAYLSCRFPRQVELDKGRYKLEVVVGQGGTSLMVEVYAANASLFQLEVDDASHDGVLGMRGYRLIAPSGYQKVVLGGDDSYAVSEPEPGIFLVENRRVTGSAYYIAALDGTPHPRYEWIRLSGYHETSMQFEYMGDKPGWVVIPVRSYPGWSARVDGKEVKPSLFKGVLPAVHVSGGDRIDFSYRPSRYLLPALVSVFGLVSCLGLFLGAQTVNKWFSDHTKQSPSPS